MNQKERSLVHIAILAILSSMIIVIDVIGGLYVKRNTCHESTQKHW